MSRATHAKSMFAPLGETYERWATVLSFGQDPAWRRFLVSRVDAGPGDLVLDVATGTGAVARELVRAKGCSVWGIDQSPGMLEQAARRLEGDPAGRLIRFFEGTADALPFDDGAFAGLTFTYLLRYVDDPASTLRELARVVRPGGVIAGLEFGVPRRLWRPLWDLWVDVGLPAAGAAIGGGWREAGSFLGPSIRDFDERWPLARLVDAWRAAGIGEVRGRRLSLGGGNVTWGRKT